MPEEKKPETPARPSVPPMAVQPWDGELPLRIREQFGEAILETSTYLKQNFLVVTPSATIPVLTYLNLKCDFDFLVDLTAVDYPNRAERFELIYILYSFSRNERIRVKTTVAEGFRPESAVSLFAGANWLEREVFDMFGIEFANHPDLRRMLLPEDWQGFPLRKDYGITQMDNEWVQKHLGIESGQ